MIRFDEHAPQPKSLDLTPLIDVIFNLLIFFVLTSAFAQPSIPLNLPEAETGKLTENKAIRITVKNRQELFIDGRPVLLAGLYPELAAVYAKQPEKELELVSDKGVPFGVVVEVMNVAKKAGAKTMAVVTAEKR